MTDPIDHRATAEHILSDWCSPVETTAEAAAVAQVHATLALVEAVDGLVKATRGIDETLGQMHEMERGW
jgi:hypothetical protein